MVFYIVVITNGIQLSICFYSGFGLSCKLQIGSIKVFFNKADILFEVLSILALHACGPI